MGFLTPILIRNDCIWAIKKNPAELLDKITMACVNHAAMSLPVGNAGNAIESLGPRHADVSRLIMVDGNTWTDLSSEFANFSREDSVWIKCLEEDVEKAAAVLDDLREKLANFRAAKEGRQNG